MPQKNTSPSSVRKSGGIDIDTAPRPTVNPSDYLNGPSTFLSKIKAGFPPSSLSRYKGIDQGNATPKLLRPTMTILPSEPAFISGSTFPMGAIIQPLAEFDEGEQGIPTIIPPQSGPLRCEKCKAYVNSSFIFLNEGQKYQCNLCLNIMSTPEEHFSTTDINGKRADYDERIDLQKGCYEYIVKSPDWRITDITYVFVIETSMATISSGMVCQVLTSIKSTIPYMKCPNNTNFAFITFGNSLQFYSNISNTNSEPIVYEISDISSSFLPVHPNKLIFNLTKNIIEINYLIDKLLESCDSSKAKNFSSSYMCTGPAIIASTMILENKGGKVQIFFSTIPNNGVGSLKVRNNSQVYNTDKDYYLLNAEDTFYSLVGKKGLKHSISFDLFCCSNNDIDLASIAPISSITGGDIFYYPFYINFSIAEQGEKLYYDIFRTLTRFQGFQTIFIVRASNGLLIENYYSGFLQMYSYNMDLPFIDADKTIGFTLKHDGKLKLESYPSIQFAMMYTSPSGETRLRIINYTFTVSDNNNNIYSGVDVESTINLIGKILLSSLMKNSIANIRNKLYSYIVNILYFYRSRVSIQSSPAQFVLPDSLRLLPLYGLGLIKSHALIPMDETKLDYKVAMIYQLCYCSLTHFLTKLYPRLYKITDISKADSNIGEVTDAGYISVPTNIPATKEKITNSDAYLIGDADYIYVYIRNECAAEWIKAIFGVDSLRELIHENATTLPEIKTPENEKLNALINELRRQKGGSFQAIKIAFQNSQYERIIILYLLSEDTKNSKRDYNYSQYLSTLHKGIIEKTGN